LKILGRNNFGCFELEDKPELANSGEKLTCGLGPCMTNGYSCKYKLKISQYTRLGETIVYDKTFIYRDPNDGEEVEVEVKKPCMYYDQKYRGLTNSHTIVNY
jgi:hypothetical protein